MCDVDESEIKDAVVSVHESCWLLYSPSKHCRWRDVSSRMPRHLVSTSEIVVVMSLVHRGCGCTMPCSKAYCYAWAPAAYWCLSCRNISHPTFVLWSRRSRLFGSLPGFVACSEVPEEFTSTTYCCSCCILKYLLCIEVVGGLLHLSIDDSEGWR